MQYEDAEPIVRIRELKKDRVNFILENVDLAYVPSFLGNGWPCSPRACVNHRLANSIRRVVMADIPTVGAHFMDTVLFNFLT